MIFSADTIIARQRMRLHRRPKTMRMTTMMISLMAMMMRMMRMRTVSLACVMSYQFTA